MLDPEQGQLLEWLESDLNEVDLRIARARAVVSSIENQIAETEARHSADDEQSLRDLRWKAANAFAQLDDLLDQQHNLEEEIEELCQIDGLSEPPYDHFHGEDK